MVNNFMNTASSPAPSKVKKTSIKHTVQLRGDENIEDSGRITDENLDFYHLLSSNILKIKESLREMSNVPLNDEDQKVYILIFFSLSPWVFKEINACLKTRDRLIRQRNEYKSLLKEYLQDQKIVIIINI
jgi:hypothetical protein